MTDLLILAERVTELVRFSVDHELVLIEKFLVIVEFTQLTVSGYNITCCWYYIF